MISLSYPGFVEKSSGTLMDPSKTSLSKIDPEKALTAYLEDGPTAEAARKVGVHADSFRAWVASPEGRRAIDTARSSLNALLDLGLTRIIDQAANHMLKAIEHGDTVVLKDGSMVKRPMSGKDAAAIMALVFDRRQLLRKQPTAIGDVDEKLEELAAKLRYLGGLPAPTAINNQDPALYNQITGPADARYTVSATDEGN